MADLRKRTALHSISAKFKPDANPIDGAEAALNNLEIAWTNDVLEGDTVLSSVPHRRALMDFEFGDLPQEIGMTLAQLFGVAAVDQITLLTAANAGLVAANTAAASVIAALNDSNADLVNELADTRGALDRTQGQLLAAVGESTRLGQELGQSQGQLLAAVGEITRLGQDLVQARATIESLKAQLAANAAPVAQTTEVPSDATA